MNSPQFKSGNVGIYNEKIPLYELRRTDMRSLVALYISEVLLYIGFILILLNNINVLEPGSYFGALNWVTRIVFSFGIIINFVSIPALYFSSFKNFKKEDDFWDKEIFWILPLFFFGTFFLYGSQINTAPIFLVISIVMIIAIHFYFILASRKFVLKSSGTTLASHQEYFTSLKYLTAYYMVLLSLLVVINPLEQIFIWIRLHV